MLRATAATAATHRGPTRGRDHGRRRGRRDERSPRRAEAGHSRGHLLQSGKAQRGRRLTRRHVLRRHAGEALDRLRTTRGPRPRDVAAVPAQIVAALVARRRGRALLRRAGDVARSRRLDRRCGRREDTRARARARRLRGRTAADVHTRLPDLRPVDPYRIVWELLSPAPPALTKATPEREAEATAPTRRARDRVHRRQRRKSNLPQRRPKKRVSRRHRGRQQRRGRDADAIPARLRLHGRDPRPHGRGSRMRLRRKRRRLRRI